MTSKITGKNGIIGERKNLDDITELILRDHKPIKELIEILKDPDVEFDKRQDAYIEFEYTLSNHATAEEESLYSHLKQEDGLRIEALEGDTEHAMAAQLIDEINLIDNDEDLWSAKVKVLAELVDHHVKEEENEVIKHARKEFDKDELIEIGQEYTLRLEELRKDDSESESSEEATQAEYV